MKQINKFLIFMSIILISGCGGSTSINDLALPPVNIIEGKVIKIDDTGFVLEDDSASIYVKAELPGNKKLVISEGQQITVYGNLQGTKKIFDAYVIKKPSGEQIIIASPKPHIGFIVQTSFD